MAGGPPAGGLGRPPRRGGRGVHHLNRGGGGARQSLADQVGDGGRSIDRGIERIDATLRVRQDLGDSEAVVCRAAVNPANNPGFSGGAMVFLPQNLPASTPATNVTVSAK